MPEAKKTKAVSVAEESATPASGKGKPTPKRKQAESANIRPLVSGAAPKDPAAKKAAKAALNEQRARAREGMLNGEERYLTIRDRGPQKKLAREVVDSRLTLGELLIPAMVLVLIVSAVPNMYVQAATVLVMWLLMIGIVADGLLISRKVRKLAADKFGETKIEKGLGWYAALRATQLRSMRIPKPPKRKK